MIRTQSITFDLAMKPQQIFDFRGAFIDMVRSSKLTKQEKELFSNREEAPDGSKGKAIERYPLIQYRWAEGKALIWAMNEGVDAIKKLVKSKIFDQFTIQNQHVPLLVTHTSEKELVALRIDEERAHLYLVFHFVPFGQDKEKEYHSMPTYIEKIKVLEQVLLNELVLLTYAVGMKTDKKITVEIVDIIRKSNARYKTKNSDGSYMVIEPQSYFMKIRSNIVLPEGIAIGRHKAYGYGIIIPVA